MTLKDAEELLSLELGSALAARVVAVMREHAGGECIYVRVRVEPPELGPHDKPADIQRRYGVSRSTAYQWVRRYRR